MKILGAYINDRRHSATPERPILGVVIDSLPVTTNPPVTYIDTVGHIEWTTAKYGPLIEYVAHRVAGEQHPISDGDFNIAFRGNFAPVVDIEVMFDGEKLEGNWAMQLRRARNLLKRETNNGWRLLLSDRDAQTGRMSWQPNPVIPDCDSSLIVDKFKGCKNVGTDYVSKGGIDYWLCGPHKAAFDAAHYAQRHSTAS